MGKIKDITGQRFGRIVVLEKTDLRNRRNVVWKCQCDCGNTPLISGTMLRQGFTHSCGCLMREVVSNNFKKHGESDSRLYVMWQGMLQRCSNPKHQSYHNYGGRGIKVCPEWHDYPTFRKWAVSHGYDENAKQGDCTLDRIDNDGDYEPDNCRWVDMKTQAKNKRNKKIKVTETMKGEM